MEGRTKEKGPPAGRLDEERSFAFHRFKKMSKEGHRHFATAGGLTALPAICAHEHLCVVVVTCIHSKSCPFDSFVCK